MSQDFPLGCALNPLAKMDLKVKASGRNKTHYGLELSSDFWLQEAFMHMYNVSLILYSGVLPLFFPSMIIPLRCLQETKTGYLLCICCYSILEGK